MRLEEAGQFEVAADPDEALAYLTDLEAVTRCLPGEVGGIEPRDDGGVAVELTARQAGASADVRVRFRVDDIDETARTVRYVGHGLGSRVKVDLEGEFALEERPDGTGVAWTGAADVGGLLSSINRGVAATVVREKLAETADNVRSALDEAAG